MAADAKPAVTQQKATLSPYEEYLQKKKAAFLEAEQQASASSPGKLTRTGSYSAPDTFRTAPNTSAAR
eukprot:586516-Hanusia_phi.AAC.2